MRYVHKPFNSNGKDNVSYNLFVLVCVVLFFGYLVAFELRL